MHKFPTPSPVSKVLRATWFATVHHGSQLRKYTNVSYLEHLLAVAMGVSLHTQDTDVIAAAILHDVLEDTEATTKDIEEEFNENVRSLVEQVTDEYTPERYPKFNREKRKRMEAERLEGVSQEAQLIKFFDLIDNTESIVDHDPGFARVYLEEKDFLLTKLTKLDEVMIKVARDMIQEARVGLDVGEDLRG